MERKEWPEKDELVICTVKEIKSFGSFVTLDEYEGKEGLIHISEIASGWVKNIRDHIKEGQIIVCNVLNVDKRKEHIDLSLKTVKASQKKEKIKQWKNEKKAKKWLSLAASKISEEEAKKIEIELQNAYGSLYDAFEDIVKKGMKAITILGIDERNASEIYNVAVANVKLPSVHITGYVELQCPLPNGIEVIKEALRRAKKIKIADKPNDENSYNIEISYIGAPKYRIKVTAPNYKKAESLLSEAASAAIEVVKRNEGEGKVYKK